MKKILLPIIMGIWCWSSYAQTPGTLDASFGTGGKVVTSAGSGEDKAYDVLVQPDGKIVVAGFTQSAITGKDFLCLRYNTDGSPDNTFGTNGMVTTDLQMGSDDAALSMAIDGNGKLLLAGYSDDGSNKNGAVVRYLTDGTIDSTFGTNGIVITNFESTYQDEFHTIQFHPLTGKIIAGGAAIISSTVSKPVVVRYTPNGGLDTSFNSTGIKTLWVTNLDYQFYFMLEDLRVQSNGKITAVGWRDFPSSSWNSDMWACRINNNGSMDATFSGDGVNLYNGSFNGNDRFSSMHLLATGNIIAAGGSYVSTLSYDLKAAEIGTNGSITAWQPTASANSGNDFINAMSIDNNGAYAVAGYSGTATSSSFVVGRISPLGTFDNSFATSGYVTTTFNGNAVNVATGVAVQTDDKIVVAGYSGNDVALARYHGYNTVGIEGAAGQESLGLYPNPVTDRLFISGGFEKVEYTVKDMMGRTVLEGMTVSADKGGISTAMLQPGMYTVSLKTNEAQVIKQFLVTR